MTVFSGRFDRIFCMPNRYTFTIKPIRELIFTEQESKVISGYQFLSKKPVFVISNLDEEQMNSQMPKEIQDYCAKRGIKAAAFSAGMESELAELDEEDRAAFAEEMGVKESGKEMVIKTAWDVVGLITFFTGSFDGEETRAWALSKGMSALESAGEIHSDIQKGFIRAEVVGYEDFLKCGSFAEAKNKGLFRLESKEYIVQDGDIMTFRFNV